MQYYKVITKPVLTPVEVEDVKDELVIEHTRHDTYLATLIDRAVDYLEKYLERPIMSQTVEIRTPDHYGKTYVELPSPVISIDSITAVEVDSTTYVETETALTVGDYNLWDHFEPTLLHGDFSDVNYDYYKVRVTCGYASEADVPPGIKDLVLLLVSARYSDRLEFNKVDISQLAVNYRHTTI